MEQNLSCWLPFLFQRPALPDTQAMESGFGKWPKLELDRREVPFLLQFSGLVTIEHAGKHKGTHWLTFGMFPSSQTPPLRHGIEVPYVLHCTLKRMFNRVTWKKRKGFWSQCVTLSSHCPPFTSCFLIFFNDSGYATQNMWQCLKFICILGSRASSILVNRGANLSLHTTHLLSVICLKIARDVSGSNIIKTINHVILVDKIFRGLCFHIGNNLDKNGS